MARFVRGVASSPNNTLTRLYEGRARIGPIQQDQAYKGFRKSQDNTPRIEKILEVLRRLSIFGGVNRLAHVLDRLFVGYRPIARSASLNRSEGVRAVGLRAVQVTGALDLSDDALDWAAPGRSGALSADQLRKGDVVVAVRGSLLKSALIDSELPFPVYPTANVAVLRPRAEALDCQFLWAWTQHTFEHEPTVFKRSSTGQYLISVRDLETLSIRLPPFSEQKEIGGIAWKMKQLQAMQAEVQQAYQKALGSFLSESFLESSTA